MIDLAISQFGWFHTILSIIALFAGIAMVREFLASRSGSGLAALFLTSAVATSLTGFGFPGGLDPAKIVGINSLVLLMVAGLARYVYDLAGWWRRIYAAAVTFAVYFLVFVTIAESFKRVPSLKAMAPTLTETPFKIVQLVALLIFIALAVVSSVRIRSPAHEVARA